jgi:hypothetical protein
MNVKRVAALGVAGGALAAWLAAAATTARRPGAVPVRSVSPAEIRGAELAVEIARLRERLRPTVPPQAPARNLFEFSGPPSRPRAASVARAETPAEVEVPVSESAPPPLTLVGIAEEAGPDGAVRTAIISARGQLIFAKRGEPVTDRYRIANVSGEAAELIDLTDHSTLTIVLK